MRLEQIIDLLEGPPNARQPQGIESLVRCSHKVELRCNAETLPALSLFMKHAGFPFNPYNYPRLEVVVDPDVPNDYMRFYHNPDLFQFREEHLTGNSMSVEEGIKATRDDLRDNPEHKVNTQLVEKYKNDQRS